TGGTQQEMLEYLIWVVLVLLRSSKYLGLGRLQHTLHAPQQRKGKDDAPVLGLFEVTTQQIGNRPEESSRLGMLRRIHATIPRYEKAPTLPRAGQQVSIVSFDGLTPEASQSCHCRFERQARRVHRLQTPDFKAPSAMCRKNYPTSDNLG